MFPVLTLLCKANCISKPSWDYLEVWVTSAGCASDAESVDSGEMVLAKTCEEIPYVMEKPADSEARRGQTLSCLCESSQDKSSRHVGFSAKFNSGQETFSMPAGFLHL